MSIEYHQILSQIQRCGNTETGHANFAPPIKSINIFEPEKFLPQGCNKIGTFLFSPSPKTTLMRETFQFVNRQQIYSNVATFFTPRNPIEFTQKHFRLQLVHIHIPFAHPTCSKMKKIFPERFEIFPYFRGAPPLAASPQGCAMHGGSGGPNDQSASTTAILILPSPLLPRKRLS
jgi:hypothetical protein